MNDFVHLRVHSTYSIKDGLAFPKQIVEWANKMKSPAVALTDEANLFGAIKFSQAAREEGIKPILGMDFLICNHLEDPLTYRVCVLAANDIGYKNLSYLSSWTQTVAAESNKRGLITRDFFASHCEGLIVLSGGAKGDVGHPIINGNEDVARNNLQWWLELCGDNYYLELQRLGLPYEESLIMSTLKLAKEYNCAPIATNDVRFMRSEDYESHRARVNINRNEILGRERDTHPYVNSQFMKEPQDMVKLFADIPQAIENTVRVAERCNFLIRQEHNLPHYPFKGEENGRDMLKRLSYEGMTKMSGADWRKDKDGEYLKRLTKELTVIDEMNYNDYFLIVSDFVNWARGHNIPVGPGRGSGGGSLVAYATGVTGLDPLEHNLLFERFLNQGRGSMPDFDIDVCMDRRDEVINYLKNSFGKENAVQIISFGTMGAKGVVRDATRVLGKPYGLGDKISNMIPQGFDLATALAADASMKEFIEQNQEAQQVFDLACKLEGQVRHTGLHAAGLVIAPGAVKDYCPLYMDEEGKSLCQYDKDDLEEIGLVKFDILGLRTLTVIEETLALIKQTDNKEIDMTNLPADDKATMQMIRSGATYSVFQLESSGMRDVAKRMQPKTFEDIVALIALFRPGPMDLIDDFIKNKQTIEEGKDIEYPDESLEDIMRPTYGIAVYQEQVMQMAQKLAGFSLSQADTLRHAMGKKKMDVMAKQKVAFIKGAVVNGYEENKAEYFFKIIEKFAGYGFNRSHSVGYGLLAYWTAYLKIHYKVHFLTANMSSELNNVKKIAALAEECRKLNINLLPPDINRSPAKFGIRKEDNSYVIDYGLGAIKGVGINSAIAIATERKSGEYKSMLDLCSRLDPKNLSSSMLESLVRAGAFSSLEQNQSLLFSSIEQGLQINRKHFQERTQGLGDMFGESLKQAILPKGTVPNEWSAARISREEHKSLGFYLCHNPFNIYKDELRRYVANLVADLSVNKEAVVCGRIYGIRPIFRNNRKMYRLSLIDESGQVQARCFEEAFNNKEHLLKNENIIAAKGKLVSFQESREAVFQINRLYGLEDLRAVHCRAIKIDSKVNDISEENLDKIKDAIIPYLHDKGLPIFLTILNDEDKLKYKVELQLLKNSRVLPSNSCLESLEEIMPKARMHLLPA